MSTRADDVGVAYPLFQTVEGGSNPTSALQLRVVKISTNKAVELNMAWHSRLPKFGNSMGCRVCYGAAFNDVYYAVAMWSDPIARMFNGKNMLELRRMAIRDTAPPNTASRMLAIMTRLIRKRFPTIEKLISYQDTAVHVGTIYKAAGWNASSCGSGSGNGMAWTNRVGRIAQTQDATQLNSPKIRWEKRLKIDED